MKITKPLNLAFLAVAGIAFACGGGEKAAETTATPEAAAPAAAPAQEVSLEDKYKDDPIYIKGIEKVKGLYLLSYGRSQDCRSVLCGCCCQI